MRILSMAIGFAVIIFSSNIFAEDIFRLGIIGTTTSHVPAFIKLIDDPHACKGFKVVAAYPGGMPDNPDSWNRVRKYAEEIKEQGIALYHTIESMLPHVDGILLESIDGRPHLEQAKPVITAGKPLFIDKPMAGSLADVIEIFRMAEEKKVPVFSSSSLRYSSGFQKMRNESPVGGIIGCDVWSPCSLNDKHPDLFWYGIHGIETLFTIMGTGCQTVQRTQTKGTDLVVGVWEDGRIGTFRGIRQGKNGYGAMVFGETGIAEAGTYEGYKPLVEEICNFFRSGESPVDSQETIEMFAFMEAADKSKQREGNLALIVSVPEIVRRAKAEVSIPVCIRIATDGTVTQDGQTIQVEHLMSHLDKLVEGKDNHRVKVILQAEKGTSIESVQHICSQLGNAMLANFLYEYE